MPLTKTQSDFVLTQLKVAPKGRVNNPLSKDSQLRRKLEDYLQREGKVVDAVNALRLIDVAVPVADNLETEIKLVQKEVAEAEREGGSKTLERAYEQLEAIKKRARDRLLPAYQEYVTLRTQATVAVGRLTQPVLGGEVAALRKSHLERADQLAKVDKVGDATALLQKVDGECTRLGGLATAYDTALRNAKQALKDAKPKMVKPDIDFVQLTMIDAAAAEAGKGRRQAALDLLAKVAGHTDLAKQADLKTNYSDDFSKPLKDLKKHACAKSFSKEIAALEQKLETVKKHIAAGLGSGNNSAATNIFSEIYWGAKAQIDLADLQEAYETENTRVVGLLKTLRDAAPKESNTTLDTEIKAIDEQLAKAGRQAARRLCELANATLKEAEKACTATTDLKQAHAGYATQLGVVEQKLKTLKPEAGTPAEADLKDLQQRLAAAKALVDPGRQFKAGKDAIDALLPLAEQAVQQAAAQGQASEQAKTALKDVGSDLPGALTKVRQLLTALKTRAGHEGVAKQLVDIEKKLGDAAKALT